MTWRKFGVCVRHNIKKQRKQKNNKREKVKENISASGRHDLISLFKKISGFFERIVNKFAFLCHGGQGICQQKETGKRPLFKPRAALRDPTLMCFLPRMTVVQGRAVEDKVEGDGKGFHPDCQWTVPEVVHEVLGIPCKVSAGGMQSF